MFAAPCRPEEIYVREQWVHAYEKQDGTEVIAHPRDAHCRQMKQTDYFQDSTKQKFTNISPKIKKWTKEEIKTVREVLSQLPPWLSKFHLAEILRGDKGGHSMNPAASVAASRTLLI